MNGLTSPTPCQLPLVQLHGRYNVRAADYLAVHKPSYVSNYVAGRGGSEDCFFDLGSAREGWRGTMGCWLR